MYGILFSIAASGFSTKTLADSSNKLYNNLRVSSDFAARLSYNDSNTTTWAIAGIDAHKIFTRSNRDFATLVFQPYLVHMSERSDNPHFSDNENTELTWRITNLNFHLDSRRRVNLKVGHFEIPFGLEKEIDTNGTINQYTFSERGIKADWGVSLNGIFSQWDYEIAISRGSGNDYSERDDSYVVSGRIGQEWSAPFAFGVSFFEGRVQTQTAPLESRFIGIDVSYRWQRYELLSELSFGEEDTQGIDRTSLLVEARWVNCDETISIYAQQKNRWDDSVLGSNNIRRHAVGVTYQFNRTIDFSGEISHQDSETTARLQGRIRL